MSDNMRLYNLAREVPGEAKKPIQAGRLKGMTDINPMYRIKRLTEMFGPCGIDWWYVEKNKEIVFDEITKQKCAFYDIELYYKDPETGEVSQGIPGTGGASFVATERNGPYMSDECYKMALTDAISVAAKAIGVAADVYFERDATKYSAVPNDKPRGTIEAAQAAGKAKLAEVEQKLAEVAEKPADPPKMATADQKTYIMQNAADDLYLKSMQQYGANLETLTELDAVRIINYIKRNAKK